MLNKYGKYFGKCNCSIPLLSHIAWLFNENYFYFSWSFYGFLCFLLLLSFSSTSMLTILVFVFALHMKTTNIICWLRKQPHQYVWASQETPDSMCASPKFLFTRNLTTLHASRTEKRAVWTSQQKFLQYVCRKTFSWAPPPPPPRSWKRAKHFKIYCGPYTKSSSSVCVSHKITSNMFA